MNKFFHLIFALLFLFTSCSPSPKDIDNTQVAISHLQTLAVSTAFAQMTANGPTATPRPTHTPRPTATYTPTPTPGAFSNPAPIGSTITLWDAVGIFHNLSATLLDVQRGDAAKQLAQQYMSWFQYVEPIEGQEYLAIYIRMELLETQNPNEVQIIYPAWHLTLRYSPEDHDIWAYNIYNILAEGYVPISGEEWVFYLIRKNTKPSLYFQPFLQIDERFGFRTQGAFFKLEP